MLILNFGHPIRDEVIKTIEKALNINVREIIEIPVCFDPDASFVDQTKSLLDGDKPHLSDREWQTEDIVIVPPSQPVIAQTLIAVLHARMGHFPTIIRLKTEPESTPTRYGLAEIIDLQQVRDQARSLINNG